MTTGIIIKATKNIGGTMSYTCGDEKVATFGTGMLGFAARMAFHEACAKLDHVTIVDEYGTALVGTLDKLDDGAAKSDA